ncbi:putative disease resistance protein At5g63020 [Tasmannia lanceolata]|uniref:putative disease resistance protein At5g63020 n=1 Tax=Tasmannia lanceolata TaxID=3420 RepID=UPI0040629F3F
MSRFNLKSPYELGKEVIRMTEIVVNLKGRGDFDEVAVCPSPPRVLEMPSTSTHGHESYEETLWHCLHGENYAMVCVHGMEGVGKTTVMKTINNRLVGTRDFDVVIWATVSKDLNIERTHLAIGSKLGLRFADDEDQESRGRKIFARLKNSRYVLMLDDLWEEIILNDVGIPKPNNENKSWNLFHEKAGEVVLLPDIQALAVKVVKECGGLPLVIITVVRKEVRLNALRELKESAVPKIEGMEPKVFRSLKLSYDYLEEDNNKLCFMYCALYPEDCIIYVSELVRYWAMEGFVKNVDNLEDASNKGHHIIERLKGACLLEEFKSNRVKMHDFFFWQRYHHWDIKNNYNFLISEDVLALENYLKALENCLSNLEELIMIGTPTKWAKEGGLEDANDNTSGSLAELATLMRLYLLHITVKDIDFLSQDSFNRRQLSSLRKFNFQFGEAKYWNLRSSDEILCIYRCEYFPLWCKKILEYAGGLYIHRCNGLTQGISELAGDSLTFKNLEIDFCPQVGCIIDNGAVGHDIEWMQLSNLPNLKKLVMGHGSLSLRQLKILNIGSCK